MNPSKKILLTGASGTVGLEVLRQLYEQKEKYEITVFDLKTDKSKRRLAPFRKDIRIIYGNICNQHDLTKASMGQDIVLHLAAIIPPNADENPDLTHKVNTLGTKNLIESLEKYSPSAFFIYSSSISIYGDRVESPLITIKDPLNPSPGDVYGKTKMESEQIIKKSQLNWSIFRLTAVMGGHKISSIMFDMPLKTSLEIVTPEDAARAFVNSAEKQAELSQKVFNLGGGPACRILYKDFLSQSFKIYGLGKVDFPANTFAEKNFHCGYYQDGNELEKILKFRNDSLADYFEKEKRELSRTKKLISTLLRKPIKLYLEKQSKPFLGYKRQDLKILRQFFYSVPN